MSAMITTRLVARSGAARLGRRAASSAFSARQVLLRGPAQTRGAPCRRAIVASARRDVGARAIATDATDAAASAAAKPFKRHERILSLIHI